MSNKIIFEDWEIAFIILSYPEFGPTELSKYLKKHFRKIRDKANELGIKRLYRQNIFIGQQFGNLLVIGIIDGIHRRIRCMCKCGKIKEYFVSNLNLGKTISCGCYRRNKNKIGKITPTYFNRYKYSAPKNNREFNLTKEFLSELFEKQDHKCALTKLPINIVDTNGSKGSTVSLDRKDSSKGYTEDNVQFLLWDINRMKIHYPQDYFIRMCKLVAENSSKDDKIEEEPLERFEVLDGLIRRVKN